MKTYAGQWVNHCKECDGQGGKIVWHTPGEQWMGQEAIWEDCETCFAAGKCLRCGNELSNKFYENLPTSVCPTCGWHYDSSE